MSLNAPKLCSACSSLKLQRIDFERPPFDPEGRYNSIALTGTLCYLRKNKDLCPLCRLITHALYRNEELLLDSYEDDAEWEMAWRQANDEFDPVTNEAENFYGSGLYPRLRTEGSYTDYCIQLVDEAPTEEFLRGRLVPESIDADRVRGWVRRCMEKHGEGCVVTYLHMGSHPAIDTEFIAIDVNAKCLVNLPPGESYVALSYVWGQSSQLTTIKSLVSGFRKAGALSRNLPRTVQDAIDLTRDLDFRYLWVDSLCIVQDEDETKGLLITKMDAIYGHAALTIVAASGSSVEAGLQGWKSSPPERQLFTEFIAPGLRLGVLPSFDRAIMQSPHAQRGWTYQEGCLSPRCLVILDGKAFFSCRAAVWREDVNAEVDNVAPLEGANTLGRTPSEWPLRRYTQHVGAYTMRQLTYQSDALNAFAGIVRALASSMAATRMFYGMPAAVFDWVVLWTGSPSLRNLKRRDGFPSWAWAGWEGDILVTPDSYSSFDQKWLLERTWIDWYLVTEEGEFVLIWDPERDQSTISPLCTASSDQSLEDLDAASVEIKKQREASKENNESLDEEGKEPNDDESEDEDNRQNDDDDDDEACPTYGPPTPNNPYGRRVHPKLLSLLPPRLISNRPSISHNLHYPPIHPGTLIFTTIIPSFSLAPAIPLHSPTTTTTTTTAHSRYFLPLQDTANRICGLIWDDLASQYSKDTNSTAVTTTTATSSAPSLASSSFKPLSPAPQTREILLLSHAAPGTLQDLKHAVAAVARAGRGSCFVDEYRLCGTREEAWQVAAKEEEEEDEQEAEGAEQGQKQEAENGKARKVKMEVDGEDILGEWHSWGFFNVMLVRRVEENEGAEEANDSAEMGVYEREGIGLLHCCALAHAFGEGPQWRAVSLR